MGYQGFYIQVQYIILKIHYLRYVLYAALDKSQIAQSGKKANSSGHPESNPGQSRQADGQRPKSRLGFIRVRSKEAKVY